MTGVHSFGVEKSCENGITSTEFLLLFWIGPPSSFVLKTHFSVLLEPVNSWEIMEEAQNATFPIYNESCVFRRNTERTKTMSQAALGLHCDSPARCVTHGVDL